MDVRNKIHVVLTSCCQTLLHFRLPKCEPDQILKSYSHSIMSLGLRLSVCHTARRSTWIYLCFFGVDVSRLVNWYIVTALQETKGSSSSTNPWKHKDQQTKVILFCLLLPRSYETHWNFSWFPFEIIKGPSEQTIFSQECPKNLTDLKKHFASPHLDCNKIQI